MNITKPMDGWTLSQHFLGRYGPDLIPLHLCVIQDVASRYVLDWHMSIQDDGHGQPTLENALFVLYHALSALHRRPNYLLLPTPPQPYAAALLHQLDIAISNLPTRIAERSAHLERAIARFLASHASWQAHESGIDYIEGTLGRHLDEGYNQAILRPGAPSPLQHFYGRQRLQTPVIDANQAQALLLHIHSKRDAQAASGTGQPVPRGVYLPPTQSTIDNQQSTIETPCTLSENTPIAWAEAA